MKKMITLLCLTALAAGTLRAQRGTQPLTNQAIEKLVGAGLADDIIVHMVKVQPGNYAQGPDDLVELRKAGVSNAVIQAMLEKQPVPAPAPTTENVAENSRPAQGVNSAASRNPAQSASSVSMDVPADPGLYVQTKAGLARIEGQAMSFTRTGSLLASKLTFGIKSAKGNAQILGKSADSVIDESQVFYFRVAASNEASGGAAGDLLLAKIKTKGERRQFEMGSMGAWRASGGLSIRSQLQCRRVQVAPGLYKIEPVRQLAAGQYAFYLFRGQQLPPFIYDFTVE